MISNEKFLETLERELYEETGIHDCYAKHAVGLKLEDIYTTASVYMAACHCAAGFRDRNDTAAFMAHAWLNSRELAEKVVSGKFKPAYYKEKEILERGKPRTIKPPKFECKVVQKVLCDFLLRAVLEPKMVSTNYASTRGRGSDKMHSDILRAINRAGSGSYIVMTDFSGFFASIDTELLCEKFLRLGMEERVVSLFHSFDPGKGLSLGNETSQVPASFFPSSVDHDLKDRMGLKCFRYMDDLLIVTKDREEAEAAVGAVLAGTENLRLAVKEEKLRLIPWGKEFVFCKERYFFNKGDKIYYRVQNPRIASNELRRLGAFERKIREGEMRAGEAKAQARSVLGSMAGHPNNRKQVERVLRKTESLLQGGLREAF